MGSSEASGVEEAPKPILGRKIAASFAAAFDELPEESSDMNVDDDAVQGRELASRFEAALEELPEEMADTNLLGNEIASSFLSAMDDLEHSEEFSASYRIGTEVVQPSATA